MTQQELYASLKEIGLPIAYHHFEDYQEPPFLVYLFSDDGDIIADNYNYIRINNFEIELYTKNKDLVTEAMIEAKLREIELPYTRSETWINAEKVFMVLYAVTIL